MSLITLPSWFKPDGFSLRQQVAQSVFASPVGGSEQAVDKLNDRWLAFVSIPPRMHADGADVEAFIASMRGMTNTVNLYHFVRRVPRGTMRGFPIVDTVAQGAAVLRILTTAGATLMAGDLIGVGSLLLQIAEDCTANGVGTMDAPIVNRARRAIAASTAVVWDKPTAPFRLMSTSSVQYVPGYAEGVSLDFAEVIL